MKFHIRVDIYLYYYTLGLTIPSWNYQVIILRFNAMCVVPGYAEIRRKIVGPRDVQFRRNLDPVNESLNLIACNYTIGSTTRATDEI